jgi:hypothetical protein
MIVLRRDEAMCCGTRAIWLKLDCLNSNLQMVQVITRRKASETGAASCADLRGPSVQPSGSGAIPNEGI